MKASHYLASNGEGEVVRNRHRALVVGNRQEEVEMGICRAS